MLEEEAMVAPITGTALLPSSDHMHPLAKNITQIVSDHSGAGGRRAVKGTASSCEW